MFLPVPLQKRANHKMPDSPQNIRFPARLYPRNMFVAFWLSVKLKSSYTGNTLLSSRWNTIVKLLAHYCIIALTLLYLLW